MIPKKIHFIWLGKDLPQWVNGLIIKRWRELNPDFEIIIHGEEAYSLCSAEYKEMYDQLEDICSKSDILRLAVLRKEGGWYFDCDFVPIRPMSDLYENHDLSDGCFLTKQWEIGAKRIANGIIGISRDAEAWKEIDLGFTEASQKDLVRTSFGPLLMTRVVTHCPFVAVGQVKDFYPIRFQQATWPFLASLEASNYSEEGKEKIFKGANPYVFHMWLGGKKYHQPELEKLISKEQKSEQKFIMKEGVSLQIVCLLHKDSVFTADYVNQLCDELEEHLHVRYKILCLTNIPRGIQCETIPLKHKWPLCWSKIELFKKGLFKTDAPVIYLDLGIGIIDNIDCLGSVNFDFAVPTKESGLDMLMWMGDYSVVYDAFLLEEGKQIGSAFSDCNEFIRAHVTANFAPPHYVEDLIEGIMPRGSKKENEARVLYTKEVL